MKRNILIAISILFLGCEEKSDVSLWQAEGLPDRLFSNDYLFFNSTTEGYLFGTHGHASGDCTAAVFKTIDGGKKWSEIKTIEGFHFANYGAAGNKDFLVLLCQTGFGQTMRSYLARFRISTSEMDMVSVSNAIGGVWVTSAGTLFYSIKKKNMRAGIIYKADTTLQVNDSLEVQAYGNEEAVFPIDNLAEIFNLSYQSSGIKSLFNIKKGKEALIKSDVDWESLTSVDDKKMILAGYKRRSNRDSTSVEMFEFRLNDRSLNYLHSFHGYNIVRNVSTSGKFIAAFVGKISSFSNKYQFIYSKDGGRSWKTKKLEEESYIKPGYLINNIYYAMAGGGRVQRIILND